jgi:hypothetical protein
MDTEAHDLSVHFREREFGLQADFAPTYAKDGSITVSGVCPQCSGDTSWTFYVEQPGVVDVAAARGEGADGGEGEEATVVCACGSPHLDRPKDSTETGCGAFWTVTLQTGER